MKDFDGDAFIGKWIGVTAHRMATLITRHLHALGHKLTHEQFVMLKIISCHEGISQKELAIKLDRDKTSIARSVSILEKQHRVVRISVAGDKRVNNLYLTRDGQELLQEIQPVFQMLADELMVGFSDEEVKMLQQSLKKLHERISVLEVKLQIQPNEH